MLKRLLDILTSLIGIIIMFPTMVIIALLIKLDSKGPVFYLATRIGKNMKEFKMIKFRTMVDMPVSFGESISPQYDPRVTSFGRFLRRSKLNELPQLINILKGDMTLVGPRPEAPDLAELYPEDAKEIFFATPGLVCANDLTCFSGSISGRNEEEMYPPGVDAKKYYIEKILPKKIEVDLRYLRKQTILTDIKFIFLAVKETLLGGFSKKQVEYNRLQISLAASDMFFSQLSYLCAYFAYHSELPGEQYSVTFYLSLLAVCVIRLICNAYFGMYNSLIKFFSFHDLLTILKAVTWGSVLFGLINMLARPNAYSGVIAITDWALLIIFLACSRFGVKYYLERQDKKWPAAKKRRVLIYGADEAGKLAFQTLISQKNINFEIIGFIDDSPKKYGKTLFGRKVLGNRFNMKAISRLYDTEEVILPMGDDHTDDIDNLISICSKERINYRVFASGIFGKALGLDDNDSKALSPEEMSQLQKIWMYGIIVKEILSERSA